MILQTERIAKGAKSLAYHNNKVIFIQGALPQELIDAEIIEEHKRYSVACIKRVLTASPHRCTNACPYTDCGACDFRYVSEQSALDLKAQAAYAEIQKIARSVTLPNFSTLAVSPHDGSRRRVRVHVQNNEMGFFAARSQRLVPIKHCLAMCPALQGAFSHMQKLELFVPKAQAQILLECDADDRVFAHIFALPKECRMEAWKEMLDTGVLSGVKLGKSTWGERWIHEITNGLHCYHELGGFMQANVLANAQLHDALWEILQVRRPRSVVDAYAGSGNFSFRAGLVAHEVVAYESFAGAEAFERGKSHNAPMLQNPDGLQFVQCNLDHGLESKGADLLIVDPPRTGLSAAFCQKLSPGLFPAMVYISCEPAILGRDLERLAQTYQVQSIQFFDMFPRTSHVETLVYLTNK